MGAIIFKRETINHNTITAEIEETFDNDFSVVVYDDCMDIWIEKFAKTKKEAEILAEKLFNKVISEY